MSHTICEQRRRRSVSTPAQSAQCLCCSLLDCIHKAMPLSSFWCITGQFESYIVIHLWRQVSSWHGWHVFPVAWTGRGWGAKAFIFEPPQDKTSKMACAPSEDSDQPGHLPSLIRVFTVRMKKAWVLSYLLSAQWRLWSDWTWAWAW